MTAPQSQTVVSPFSVPRLPAAVKMVVATALLTYVIVATWSTVPDVEITAGRDAVIVAVYWLIANTFIFTRGR